jgi:endoglucanase
VQTVSSDWGSGYTGAIRFTNTGSSAINGWTIGWKYSDGTQVTSAWNAILTGSNPYSATNVSYNSAVQPGQSVEVGFNANKGSAAVSAPTFSGACL